MKANREQTLTFNIRCDLIAMVPGSYVTTAKTIPFLLSLHEMFCPRIEHPEASCRHLLQDLIDEGWFVRIHKGLYQRTTKTETKTMGKATGKSAPALRVVSETDLPSGINVDEVARLSLTIPVDQIEVSRLTVPKYQESRSPYLVPARAAACRSQLKKSGGWQDFQCEVLTVVRLKDGTLEIVAGVGRKFMAEDSGVGSVPCRIIDGSSMTYADRVALFQRLGTLLYKLTPIQLWKANYGVKGHPEVKAICDIVDRLADAPKITLSALKFCHERKLFGSSNEAVLEQALVTVSKTALGSNAKLVTMFVCAVGAILSIGKLDGKRFRELNAIKGKKADLEFVTALFNSAVRKANSEGFLKPQNRTIAWFIAQELLETYNHGKKGPRIHASYLEFEHTEGHDVYSTAKAKR